MTLTLSCANKNLGFLTLSASRVRFYLRAERHYEETDVKQVSRFTFDSLFAPPPPKKKNKKKKKKNKNKKKKKKL